jgi:hypothetical protein
MAFNFKKALAFTLAAAMVVTAAPSASITADAAAKKPSITKSKTINADKTASIKVNTVKKGRFIKITSISKAANVTIKAKINGKNTKLKKNKYYKVTGKSVTLKVTGADSIADYTSTIKVSVFDKKGKKYKVVKPKNLTAKVKVKASEFSITNVVSTVDAVANGSKYVRATFSKAIDALDASEVEITEKGSGQIFTVKKVTLSSNKKMADIELLGDDNAGGIINWLKPNVDYIFKITKAGVTGQFEFSIPDVAKDSVVTAVDAKKKTIKANALTGNPVGWAGEATYTVPDSLKVDYEELLGTTQNIKFDKTNTIISISPIGNEKVVYSAFEAKDDDGDRTTKTDNYIYDVATKTKYYAQDTVSGTIPQSKILSYAKLDNHADFDSVNIGAWASADATKKYAYGKLVLNGNGTIRTWMPLDKWSGNLYVSSVNGTYISTQAKEEQNLADYAILKDGKTITVSDIKAGDIVFFQTAYKYAEVYTASKTGALEAAYDDGFKFGGESYKSENASYFDTTGARKDVDASYLKGVLASKKDVVVYFNRANEPVYVLGEESVVASADTTLILTADGDGYQDKKDNMLELKGFNGSEVVTKNINVSDLETITKLDKDWKKSTGKMTVNGGNAFTTATKNETLDLTYSDGSGATIKINGSNNDLCVGKMVILTADKDGKITGLVVGNDVTLTGGAGQTQFDGNAEKDFKGGYKNIDTANFGASTPIYVVNKVNNDYTVKVQAYSEFTQIVKNAVIDHIHVYFTNDKKETVKAIVIDNTDGKALGEDDDGSVTSEVIVKDISYLDKAISSITVLNNGVETTYGNFEDSIKTEFKKGAIVKITILKDGKTVKKAGVVADGTIYGTGNEFEIANVSESKGTFDLKVGSGFVSYQLDSQATIAQINDDEKVEAISKTDLADKAKTYKVIFSETVTNSKKVDTILVTAEKLSANGGKEAKGQTLMDVINAASYVASACAVSPTAMNAYSTADRGMVISGKACYDMAKDDLENIEKAIKDFESAGGSFVANGYLTQAVSGAAMNRYLYTKDVVEDAVKDAKKNLIIGISYLGTVNVTSNSTCSDFAFVKGNVFNELPSKVTFTLADDSETEVSLDKGSYTDTPGLAYAHGDWVVSGGATTALVAAPQNLKTDDIMQFVLTTTGSVYTALGGARISTELGGNNGDGINQSDNRALGLNDFGITFKVVAP